MDFSTSAANGLTRRGLLELSAGALASAATLAATEPRLSFPSLPRERLAVTSWPFRAYMDAPGNRARDLRQPGIDARNFAATVADRFGIHNINPLTSHFRSTDPAYLDELRSSVAKAHSHIVDLGHGGRCFYHPDPAKRREAIEFGSLGVDIAARIGSPSVRQHLHHQPGATADVGITAETLGELAAHGEKKNIVVNLENDAPVSEDPFFLVAVINKVRSPYLRALPDFANSMNSFHDAGRNYQGVEQMFRHVFNMCHVKSSYEEAGGKRYPVDLGRLFAIAKASGYRGYFSMETETSGDPFEATRQLAERTLEYLA